MPDAYQLRLKAIGRIRKLLALAQNNPNSHEAEQALGHAKRLAEQHGVDLDTLKTTPPPRNVALPPDTMRGMVGAISRAYPGIDNEDYSQYARQDRPSRATSEDPDDEVPL
jgi:hypothetical protein